jgi:exoribonuclease II
MPRLPYIVTADCSSPREIDDGLYIQQMDEERELYRVGVCVVDASGLYNRPEVVKQAQERTEAKYWDLPNGERGYDPMIEEKWIRDLEFKEGTVRDALKIDFYIGPKDEPEDPIVSFGPVKVGKNFNYKQFAMLATTEKYRKFQRVAELIQGQLGYVAYGDHVGVQPQWRGEATVATDISGHAWKRGSKMNEAYMVAANYLVGRLLAAEGRPAVYRVHDPEDEQFLELLSANMARYSRTPGPHSGLKLDPYCRVTSPLRRLDDFVMSYQLKQRFLGKPPVAKDSRDVAFAVRRLNQEIIAAAPKDAARFSRQDILGRTAVNGVPSAASA